MGTASSLSQPPARDSNYGRKRSASRSAPSMGRLASGKMQQKRFTPSSPYASYRSSLVESEGTQTQTWGAWLRRAQQLLEGPPKAAPSSIDIAAKSSVNLLLLAPSFHHGDDNFEEVRRGFHRDNKKAVEYTEDRMRRVRKKVRWQRAAQKAIASKLVSAEGDFAKAVQDWREKYYSEFNQALSVAHSSPFSRHTCTETSIPISATSYSCRPISKTRRLTRAVLAKLGVQTKEYFSSNSLLRIESLEDFNQFWEDTKRVSVTQEPEAYPLLPTRTTKYTSRVSKRSQEPRTRTSV